MAVSPEQLAIIQAVKDRLIQELDEHPAFLRGSKLEPEALTPEELGHLQSMPDMEDLLQELVEADPALFSQADNRAGADPEGALQRLKEAQLRSVLEQLSQEYGGAIDE